MLKIFFYDAPKGSAITFKIQLHQVITGFQNPPGMFLSYNSGVDFRPRFQKHPAGAKSISASKNLPGSIFLVSKQYMWPPSLEISS